MEVPGALGAGSLCCHPPQRSTSALGSWRQTSPSSAYGQATPTFPKLSPGLGPTRTLSFPPPCQKNPPKVSHSPPNSLTGRGQPRLWTPSHSTLSSRRPAALSILQPEQPGEQIRVLPAHHSGGGRAGGQQGRERDLHPRRALPARPPQPPSALPIPLEHQSPPTTWLTAVHIRPFPGLRCLWPFLRLET